MIHIPLWNTFHNRMRKGVRSKIIQVPIDSGLLSDIDESAGLVAESRAEFIRKACRERLRSLVEAELDRRYVEGYRKTPEKESAGRANAKLLAKLAPEEKW